MKKAKIDFGNFIINVDNTIKEAMVAISDNKQGSVIVVTGANHLVGVVSDGDIRRSLVAGRVVESRVEEIVNINPISLQYDNCDQKQAAKIFLDNVTINLIPVVDKQSEVVEIIIRDQL